MTPTPRERLLSKTTIDLESGCWIWTASRTRSGYGFFTFNNRTCRAHRIGYELLVGPIPDGLDLDHLCRNRACVNPSHLEPVTRRENLRRSRQYHATRRDDAAESKFPGAAQQDQQGAGGKQAGGAVKLTSRERLLSKALIDLSSGCWVWTAVRNEHGYGLLKLDKRMQRAHRVAYTLIEGPIPDGLDLDHLCRNRACINPAHLQPVTRRENTMRWRRAAQQGTHSGGLK